MASKFLPLFLLVAATVATAAPVTISGTRPGVAQILGQFPKFAMLSRLLTETGVAADIDSRRTITLLAVADPAMSSVAGLPADVLRSVLSVHVVLDFYDVDKISNLPNATALLTTLFQASGKAVGGAGFVNATDVGDGQVKLGSAVDGNLVSDVIREIASQPYNISVIEISQVIVPPGIAASGPARAPKVGPVSPVPVSSTPAPETATDAPAASAEGPAKDAASAGPAGDKKVASSGSRSVVGVGMGALGAALLAAAAL